MSDELNQMGLFGEITAPEPAAPPVKREPPREKKAAKAEASKPVQAAAPDPVKAAAERLVRAAAARSRATKKPEARVVASPRKVSGLVPEGDVRLTANIRQDLHLKLKITSAYRRTTIGELIEELVEKYL